MAGKLASRRDNPAARAALARRRQRAANLIRPPKEQEQERAPTTKGAVVAYTKPKPLGKEIIPPSSKTRTPPRKTRVNPDTLIVDTSSVIEVIQSPQKQISPLMQPLLRDYDFGCSSICITIQGLQILKQLLDIARCFL